MPYIRIATTVALTPEERDELRRCALDAAEGMGKRRQNVMVHIEDAQALTRGDGDGNCAFCDVRVMGDASPEACARLAQTLSDDIARIARTAPGCAYLSISELTRCHTDGRTPPGHPDGR